VLGQALLASAVNEHNVRSRCSQCGSRSPEILTLRKLLHQKWFHACYVSCVLRHCLAVTGECCRILAGGCCCLQQLLQEALIGVSHLSFCYYVAWLLLAAAGPASVPGAACNSRCCLQQQVLLEAFVRALQLSSCYHVA
jgi:hypothetical protein